MSKKTYGLYVDVYDTVAMLVKHNLVKAATRVIKLEMGWSLNQAKEAVNKIKIDVKEKT